MANARQFMAARTAAWAKSGGWVNPYQTTDEALVVHWDATWNDGPNKHSYTRIDSIANLGTWGGAAGVYGTVNIDSDTLILSPGSIGANYNEILNTTEKVFSLLNNCEVHLIFSLDRISGFTDNAWFDVMSTATSIRGLRPTFYQGFLLGTFEYKSNNYNIAQAGPSASIGHIYNLYCRTNSQSVQWNFNDSGLSGLVLSRGLDSGFVDANVSVGCAGWRFGQGVNYEQYMQFKSFRLYNRNLTDEERNRVYAIDCARFNIPDAA